MAYPDGIELFDTICVLQKGKVRMYVLFSESKGYFHLYLQAYNIICQRYRDISEMYKEVIQYRDTDWELIFTEDAVIASAFICKSFKSVPATMAKPTSSVSFIVSVKGPEPIHIR